MNLGHIFKPGNQSVKQTNTSGTNGPVTTGERNYRIQSEIRNMTPGQTIQGEVVGKDGNTVQIALDSDTFLTARLERDLNIALGQNMSFEVKSNSGSMLSLTPLYANMANEATILKALSAAALPVNESNMKMVSDMMQEGMPIDRDSIAYVNRQLVDFPDADPASVIQMIRLGMPVSEINLEQFELYKNYEHQIVQSAEQIMEEIPQTYLELLAEGKDADAVSFYQQIINVFLGGESAESADGEAVLLQNAADGTENADTAQNGMPGAAAGEVISEEAISEKVILKDALLKTDQPEVSENKTVNTDPNGNVLHEIAGREIPDKFKLSLETWQKLGNMMQKLGADESIAKQIANGTLSPKETLSRLNELLAGNSHVIREDFQETVKEFLGSREFRNLLRTEMSNQWLLKPEEVAQKENVEQLYERIREQTAKMNEAFQMADKADTAGAKSVQNLHNNVDFMNQMNQMFTYVQLPLKMAGNQAHGDLYVYTNKKSLAKKDGSVSALLHLDMEHLGPLDVYVAMQTNLNKVTTNFTLKDEESLDFIAEHIHILNERLEKRGYDMKANFQVKEEETNIMQEILEQSKNISVLSRTSFDMRA